MKISAVTVIIALFIISSISSKKLISKQLPSDDFSSSIYQSMTANQKLDKIWKRLTENQTPLDYYSPQEVWDLLNSENFHLSFQTVSDIMPKGRKKILHTQGLVSRVEFNIIPNKYSGLFKSGSKYGIVRLSVSNNPKTEQSTPEGAFGNFVPSAAFKFFRDNQPSANILVMYGNAGGATWNFFKNNLSNSIKSIHCVEKCGEGTLDHRFREVQGNPAHLGLLDVGKYEEDGSVAEDPTAPFEIIFKPNKELQNKFSDNYTEFWIDQLKRIPTGIELYEVYAIDQPNSTEEVKIGSIKLQDPLDRSLFGDEKLFFQHHFYAPDAKGRPDWLKEDKERPLNHHSWQPYLKEGEKFIKILRDTHQI